MLNSTATLARGELPRTSIHYLLELAQCGRMHTLTVLDACYVRRHVSYFLQTSQCKAQIKFRRNVDSYLTYVQPSGGENTITATNNSVTSFSQQKHIFNSQVTSFVICDWIGGSVKVYFPSLLFQELFQQIFANKKRAFQFTVLVRLSIFRHKITREQIKRTYRNI